MKIEEYYNKFNEEKRLLSRHGQVEFFVTLNYVLKALNEDYSKKILDVGAGTGRYSIALYEMGYKDVTALELCKPNIGQFKAKLKKNNYSIPVYQGNAISLKKFKDNTFDVTLVFGPMYHLHKEEDKVSVLKEAKRVTKDGGIILVAYVMNDYSILSYGFMDNHIKECIEKGEVDSSFHTRMSEEDLYDYVRIEDIDHLNELVSLNRIQIIGVDGPTDYMRPVINKMDEETFELYKKYCLEISTRLDMIGCSSHTLDILKK